MRKRSRCHGPMSEPQSHCVRVYVVSVYHCGLFVPFEQSFFLQEDAKNKPGHFFAARRNICTGKMSWELFPRHSFPACPHNIYAASAETDGILEPYKETDYHQGNAVEFVLKEKSACKVTESSAQRVAKRPKIQRCKECTFPVDCCKCGRSLFK